MCMFSRFKGSKIRKHMTEPPHIDTLHEFTINTQITKVYLLCNGSVAVAGNSRALSWDWSHATAKYCVLNNEGVRVLLCICVFVNGTTDRYKRPFVLTCKLSHVMWCKYEPTCTKECLYTATSKWGVHGGAQPHSTHTCTCKTGKCLCIMHHLAVDYHLMWLTLLPSFLPSSPAHLRPPLHGLHWEVECRHCFITIENHPIVGEIGKKRHLITICPLSSLTF